MNKGSSIIIVEDEAIVAMESRLNLQAAGFSVLAVVSSAEEVIVAAAEKDPDLVIMDIMLKGSMNGIEAAIEIRKQSNVPILFITGNSDQRTKEQVGRIPFASLLHKPILTNDLLHEIQRMLNIP
jgi:two-component system, response regulator PdtaR